LMVDVELLYLQALKVRLDFVNGIVLLDLQNVIKTLRWKHVLSLGKDLLTIAEGYRMLLKLLIC
jgi:hypothetical protein